MNKKSADKREPNDAVKNVGIDVQLPSSSNEGIDMDRYKKLSTCLSPSLQLLAISFAPPFHVTNKDDLRELLAQHDDIDFEVGAADGDVALLTLSITAAKYETFCKHLERRPEHAFVITDRVYVPVLGLHAFFPNLNETRLPDGFSIERLSRFNADTVEVRTTPGESHISIDEIQRVLEAKFAGTLYPSNSEFVCDRDGVFKIGNKGGRDAIAHRPVWLAASGRLLSTGDAALVIGYLTRDGKAHLRAARRSDLLSRTKDLSRGLMDSGCELVDDTAFADACRSWLSEDLPSVSIADRTGWLSVRGKHFFCAGERVIAPHGHEHDLLPFGSLRSPMSLNGTLDDWKRHVFSKVRTRPFVLGMLSLGLAGGLVDQLGINPGIFHIGGSAGGGKTRILGLLASLYGCGADPGYNGARQSESYMQRHNSTARGLEQMAASYGSLPLLLDEIGDNGDQGVARSVYSLCAGLTKAASTSDGKLRSQGTWRHLIFSTGEISMRQVITAAYGQVMAGQDDRAVDLEPDTEMWGAFNSRKELSTFMANLSDACSTYFGTASEAVFRYLINSPDEMSVLPDRVRKVAEEISPEGLSSGAQRVVRRFAAGIVAGHIAVDAGVFECEHDDITEAVKSLVALWHRGKCRPLMRVVEYCVEKAAKASNRLDGGCGKPLYVLRARKTGQPVVAIPRDRFDDYFEEEAETLVKALDCSGMLVREQQNRTLHRFGSNSLSAYAIPYGQVVAAMGDEGHLLPQPL